MVFSSVSFLVFFLPSLLAIYFVVPKRCRQARNIVLLVFSLIFFGFGGVRFLFLLISSITLNYVCGLFASDRHAAGVRKSAVVCAVVLGLGLLGWFKYAGFFASTVVSLGAAIPIPEIVLPIGISFFTFQGLSYVIDVYRGEANCQRNPLKVALYIALFPQLVAGPIVRYTTVESELTTRSESVSEFSEGTVRFLFGLGKKMILANSMGTVADAVFSKDATLLSAPVAWVAIAAYAFQIYFDFSAYSDMAIGLGRMFGFHFLENFNYPYIADSVTDFWRRWHISLSTWFRDYVYIPLGGNRGSKANHIRNLVVVWLLTGLWHGAAWNFVLWGALFALFLVGEKYVWGKLLTRAPNVLRHAYTILVVLASWVLFRSPDLAYAGRFFTALLGFGGGYSAGEAVYHLAEYWPEWILCIVAVFPLKNRFQEKLGAGRGKANRLLIVWGPKILALLLLLLSYMKLATGGFNTFIYFQF